MNSEQIMKSDVLDIIFEKRNKTYGAYDLRKFYNNRLVKSMGIMMGVVTVFSAFTLLDKKPVTNAKIIEDPTFGNLKPMEIKKEPKKEAASSAPKKQNKTAMFTKPIIVDHTTKASELPVNLDSSVIASKTFKGTGEGAVIEPPGDGDGGEGPIDIPVATIAPADMAPADRAEVMPSFPGGMEALSRFLQRNMRNPRDMEEGEQVSVNVKFVVGYDGKLQAFSVLRDGGKEFNNEVIRVLKKMPDWIPGKNNGHSVPVYFNLPVKFVAQD